MYTSCYWPLEWKAELSWCQQRVNGIRISKVNCFGERYVSLRKERKERVHSKIIRNLEILMVGAEINYREAILAKSTKRNCSHITESLVNWEAARTSLSCDCLFWRTWTGEEYHHWSYLSSQVQRGARNKETKEEMSVVEAMT